MDLLSNFVCSVKNACGNNCETVTIQASKVLLSVSSVLKNEGMIDSLKVVRSNPNKLYLQIQPSFHKFDNPKMKDFKRVSKPGFRKYWSIGDMKKMKVLTHGSYIISTSQGVMIDRDAIKKNLGGEVLCKFERQ